MSRCIDANDLVRKMTLQANRTMFGEVAPPQLSYEEMLELIADAPTVDVVPKSDVDLYKKQVGELEDELASTYDKLENANAEVAKLSEINSLLSEAGQEWQRRYNDAKAEAVKEVFEEIDVIFRKYYNKCSESTELKLLESLCQAERFIINEMWQDIAEFKKKYLEPMA